MRWIIPMMWAWCRAVAWACQLAGVAGLGAAAALAMRYFIDRLTA